MTRKTLFTLTFLLLGLMATANSFDDLTRDFVRGKVALKSISVMTFSPEGVLFIGDSKAGKVIALDVEDKNKNESTERFTLEDVETKLGSLLGTDADGVIIHDMAVNPYSQNVYLAVSRSDANELGFWRLPNDISDAGILVRIHPDGKMEEVSMENIRHSSTELPKVIEEGPHRWRKTDKRTEAITDLAYKDGKLYVAGLSNEEFASALRVVPFPFKDKVYTSTIEVFHVAHGKSETEAPIRTLIPYQIDGEEYILAAYTCTPFVSIPVSSVAEGKHVKSKTLAEFGSGNMPVDIVHYQNDGKDYFLLSSNSKALIEIKADKIAQQKKGLTEPLEKGEYTAGMDHDVLSIVGVTQIDNLNSKNIVALQRMPNGLLNINSIRIAR